MPQKKSSDKNKPQSGQRSEAYATLFYHHPIPMWVYDLNTLAFLEVNDAAVQNYGYSREEFLSMTLKDIRPPEDIDLLLKDTAKERPTLQYSGEWRHTLKNGKVILVEIRSHTIEYNGRPAALVVATDVTERKRAEDAFIESHRKYQKVVESASEIIYTTDLRGHFLYANPAGLRSVGYSLEEMHKRSYLDLVLPEHRKRVKRAYFKQYLEKTPTSYIEFPFRTKFGTVCWFGQNATLLYQEGTIVGFQLIAREITEKVHAETQIKHLNRIYSVLSNINQAIVRIHDKQQLLNEACRIAITEGNFLMAWIGLLNTETLAIDVVASAGKVDNYLSNIKINLGDDKCCFDPTGRAMKTGIRVISMDIEHDEAMDPLRDDALKLGYRSSASFPLRVLGTIIGTFNLYSDEIGFFTEDELKLLDELAMDISFALEYIERDTERKQAEEEVQKKEELLRLLIETLPIGIWIIDKTGKIIHSNPAGRKIWEGEIFVGIEQYGEYKGWWTETGKEILPEEWAAARAISKGEISINELVDIQCFDGTRKTIYNSAQPIRDTEGKIIGAFIVNEDITKRRRAEEAIVDSEARYRRLFEAARDGILILNADTGRIEDVNPFLAEMLGFSHEDLLGKDIIDLGFLKDVIANKEKFLELQQKEYVRYENLPLESVDGRKFDVEFVSNVYLVNNKKVIQCNIRDITDRKRAEVAFVESEERFRQLAENIHEVFWLTDRSKQTMLYISPAYELIWGRTRESLYASSLTWLNSIHPEDRERVHQAAQAKQVEGVYDEEYRIIRPDGGIRWIRDRAFPVQNEKGEVYRIAGVAEDITERIRLAEDRKNLEAQLHQAQKLESLGTLASGIAHDFNNILTIIIGHASLLERSKADPLTIKKNTEAIIGAGMRGADLVKQMLTFARKADVMIEAVRLNDIVKEIVKLIYQTFPKTIKIVTELDRSLPIIEADATQVHQVILNLCVNARDAMENSGTLTIRTQCVRGEILRAQFPTLLAEGYIALSITDTGMGMNTTIRERIFEPFFTTKEQGKGTGLGLSLVFGIVNKHNGAIDVQTKPGKGTTFIAYFPAPSEPGVTKEQRVETLLENMRGNETILIVEDEEMVRGMLAIALESHGYLVLKASNGKEAVEVYRENKNRIQAVVSDYGLPMINGFESYKQMKRITPQLPFILASGFIDPKEKSKILQEGIIDIIQKPYKFEQVARAIRRALDNR